MVFRDVLLHLWRLFRALSSWEIAGSDRRKDASRRHHSGSLAGDGCSYGNSEPDAVSVPSPAYWSESLDEYRVRRDIQRDHDFGDQGRLALLCLFRIDRNHPDTACHLVCMDLAEATKPLTAVTT